MNTSLQDDIRQAFARQADHTTIGPNAEFRNRPLRLDSNEPRGSRSLLVTLLAAAAVAAVTVTGLVALSTRSGERPAQSGQPSTATDPTLSTTDVPQAPAAATPDPSETQATLTTVSETRKEFMEGGVLICLDAGASPRAVSLCVEEFGGQEFSAATESIESFLMPVDPTNASSVDDANRLGKDLNLDVHPYDPSYVPTDLDLSTTGATIVMVLGSTDMPYADARTSRG